MNQWLKVKNLGLPRWAWLGLGSGAVLLGLYLRSRNAAESEIEPEDEAESVEGELDYYEGSDAAGGLAAAGLVGPGPGSLVPVQAPYVPEGIPEIIESQGATIQALAEREPGEGPERIETVREIEPREGVTGGGPPRRKPHHKPPRKKPKKQPKPKAKKPPKRKRGGGKKRHKGSGRHRTGGRR